MLTDATQLFHTRPYEVCLTRMAERTTFRLFHGEVKSFACGHNFTEYVRKFFFSNDKRPDDVWLQRRRKKLERQKHCIFFVIVLVVVAFLFQLN